MMKLGVVTGVVAGLLAAGHVPSQAVESYSIKAGTWPATSSMDVALTAGVCANAATTTPLNGSDSVAVDVSRRVGVPTTLRWNSPAIGGQVHLGTSFRGILRGPSCQNGQVGYLFGPGTENTNITITFPSGTKWLIVQTDVGEPLNFTLA